MKLSDYVIEKIADIGVSHVFMLPGGGAMHLNDSLGRSRSLEYVVNLHEQACAIAADAYSQYTNNLGVCLVTTGPGGTNALTGVAASFMDSVPLLVISGQVKTADLSAGRGVRQFGFQEIDIVAMAKPITKYAVTVTEPEKIRYHLEKAIWIAQNRRPGPCWLDIPLDVQAAEVDPDLMRGFRPESVRCLGDDDTTSVIKQTIEILQHSERPVLLVGNGVRSAGGLALFEQLIAVLQIPVLTTWKAADFLAEDDPLFAGRPGAIGQRGANFTQQNSDCLITIGARLDLGQTAYNHANFAPGAQRIFVDIDRAELDKMVPRSAIPVCADAGDFINGMLKHLQGFKRPKVWSDWLLRVKVWQQKYPVVLPEYWESNDCVNDYLLIDLLAQQMTADDLLIPGSSGACSERTMQAFKVKKGQRIFNSQGLGSMGFGLAAAIGGCVASNRRRTIMIEGDGGFAMNLQELETVRRFDLPLKMFILNNGGYASIKATQRNYFGGKLVASDLASGLTLPDWQLVAKAFNIPELKIEKNSQIYEVVRLSFEEAGPVLVEVMVDPDQQTMPRVVSRRRHDGVMESTPLENLWPFLDH